MAKKKKTISAKKRKLINLKISIKARQRKIDKELDKIYEINPTKISKKEREKRNELFELHMKLNGLLHEVQADLNKLVKKPVIDKKSINPNPSFDYDNSEDFIISEKSNCEDLIFELNKFNGFILKKDAEQVHEEIDEAWKTMASNDIYRVEYTEEEGIGYIIRLGRKSQKEKDSEFEPS